MHMRCDDATRHTQQTGPTRYQTMSPQSRKHPLRSSRLPAFPMCLSRGHSRFSLQPLCAAPRATGVESSLKKPKCNLKVVYIFYIYVCVYVFPRAHKPVSVPVAAPPRSMKTDVRPARWGMSGDGKGSPGAVCCTGAAGEL